MLSVSKIYSSQSLSGPRISWSTCIVLTFSQSSQTKCRYKLDWSQRMRRINVVFSLTQKSTSKSRSSCPPRKVSFACLSTTIRSHSSSITLAWPRSSTSSSTIKVWRLAKLCLTRSLILVHMAITFFASQQVRYLWLPKLIRVVYQNSMLSEAWLLLRISCTRRHVSTKSWMDKKSQAKQMISSVSSRQGVDLVAQWVRSSSESSML